MKESELRFFREILEINSTTGEERKLADMLLAHMRDEGIDAEFAPMPHDAIQPANVFAKWGRPDIVFCTHLDTVPPYISPAFDGDEVRGRGSCDAKGQIISMYLAWIPTRFEANILLIYFSIFLFCNLPKKVELVSPF